MYMTFDLSKKKIYVCVFFMRLNSVRSWRKALLLRQPMKTGHVILLQDIHSSTSLFCFFPSIPVPSVTLYFTLWIFKDETFIIWVSVTDFLLHTKSQPTQSRFCVHNHHQRSSNTQKVSNFPFHWFNHLHFVLNKSK